jgi:hypothetical protein
MKMNTQILYLTLLLNIITLAKSNEPGLKINLNPPEENVKDTIGKE